MELSGRAKRVTIFVGERSGEHGKQNYVRILERLKAEGAAGATAFKAIAAFGARAQVETIRLVDVAPNLPVMIVWIDSAERVERILPHIREMIAEGLIAVEDAEVLLYTTAAVPDLPNAVTVGEVMTRDVATIQPQAPMRELVALLIGLRLHAVPVVEGDRQVIGIVTIGDLFIHGGLPIAPEIMESFDTPQLHEVLHHLAQSHAEVREIMTAPVVTVHPELDVRHAAELMCRRVLVRVPVVDAEGRLAGIVSRADLLRAVAGGPSERRLEFPQPAHTDGTTPISAIMTHDVPAIRVDTTLRQVVDAVVSTQLNRAVVVDAEERVIGIVTDAELIDRLTPALHPGRLKTLMHHLPFVRATPQQEEAWHHATGNRARDFLIRDIVVACEEEPIREVLARVIEKVRQIVPIVADDQRLVGVVDRIDLLGVLTGVATAPFDP